MKSVNVARRVVEKYDLSPPVDIVSLLAEAAIVLELDWPFDCDGIVVGLTDSGKPRAFIKASQPKNRDRFTRAHEWGHIMIPWHLGDVALECDVSRLDPVGSISEREANDFASRILVPDRYMNQALAKSSDVTAWIAAVEPCEISAYASMLALQRNLPAGFSFILDHADSQPLLPISSPGTHTPPMTGEPSALIRAYREGAIDSGRMTIRGRQVWWFRYIDLSPPVREMGGLSANEALERYLERTGDRLPDGRSKRQSINGVIGGKLRDVNQVDVGWMHGTLRYHISCDSAWSHALGDSDFDSFLVLRVTELSAKRSADQQ